MLSRQRTRPVTCSTSSRLMSAGSVTSGASTLATSGTARRRRCVTCASASCHRVGRRLHQRAVEGRADLQQDAALGAPRLGRLDRALDGRLVAADHDLAGAVVVGDAHDLALRRLLARLLRRLELDARAARPWRPRRPARPAASTGRAASAAARRRRVAARRPPPGPNIRRANGRRRRRPAIASGLPPSFSRMRTTARLTAISAGWAFSVRISSDSGPSRISFERFCFSASSTSWNTSRAVAKAAGQVHAHADGLGSLSRKDEGAAHGPFLPGFWPVFAGLSIPHVEPGPGMPCFRGICLYNRRSSGPKSAPSPCRPSSSTARSGLG